MSKVSYIPKDYNSITPYLVIRDAARAIDYYKKVFGATELFRMNGPDGKVFCSIYAIRPLNCRKYPRTKSELITAKTCGHSFD